MSIGNTYIPPSQQYLGSERPIEAGAQLREILVNQPDIDPETIKGFAEALGTTIDALGSE